MANDLLTKTLEQYSGIADEETLDEIRHLAAKLQHERIAMINSTPSGGGVAEILNNLVVLMNNLGLRVDWLVIKGSDNFFQVTKEMHNALQGGTMVLSERKQRLYEQTNFNNAAMMHLEEYDLVVVHDPQPLPLIAYSRKRIPWVWRAHIDLSRPHAEILRYLKRFIERYDAMIITAPAFRQPQLNLPQIIIHPSIDPLSIKNAPLPRAVLKTVLRRQGIRVDKPILAQISRFDVWKDPLGVIDVFERVRKRMNCRLILLGNMALDDPEGPVILRRVQERANDNPDIDVLVNCPDNDRTVNTVQAVADVVLQKSRREGFALTVSEAMWKRTPVVGTRVGGIPLQIVNGKTGYLVENNAEAAAACLRLLRNRKLRQRFGRQAKAHVRKHFLITRQVLDELRLFDFYLNRQHRFNIGLNYPYGTT